MLRLIAILLSVLAIIVNVTAFAIHTMAGSIIGAGIALVMIATSVACIMVLADQ